MFGCVQVGVFAATHDAGAPAAAGPVLAAFAVGSLAAGLVAGAATGGGGSGAALRRYRRVLVVLAAGMLLPAIGPAHPVLLAALLTVADLAESHGIRVDLYANAPNTEGRTSGFFHGTDSRVFGQVHRALIRAWRGKGANRTGELSIRAGQGYLGA